jgi:Ca2+/Na+ antiporter
MFNLLLVTGGSAFFIQGGIHLGWKPIIRDLGIYFIGLLALYVFLLGTEIQLWQSMVLLGIYILSWLVGRWGATPHAQEEPRAQARYGSVRLGKRADWKAFGSVVFALSVILVASHFMISSAVGIATFLHIPPAMIAVTLLAAGASVPDMLSAFHEAKKGEGLIAVLQALQSNSFDVLFTIGFVTLVTNLAFHSPVAVLPNGLYNLVELGASVLIVIVVLGLNKWHLGKLQGCVFILMFIGYWLQQVLFFHR